MTTRLFLLAGLLWSSVASAATWPGPAPCDATLQACIDATAAGDTVTVASSAVIDESLFINKPLALLAAPGFRPILAVDRVINASVSAAGSWAWRVEGFELRRGYVGISVNGGSAANIAIRRVRVRETLSGIAQVALNNNSTASIVYDLAQNELEHSWSTSDGALRAALQVLDRSTGTSTGRIRDNRIVARGSEAIGILVSTQDRNHATQVVGNHVLGGNRGSIFLRQGSLIAPTAGALQARVLNNVVRSSAPDAGDADGIAVDIYDGSAHLLLWHNTVVDAFRGVDLYADTSATALGGSIVRNVFSDLAIRGVDRSGAFNATNLPDRENLFFDTSDLPTAVGPGSIFADARFVRAPEDLHLRADSPAIDAASGVELADLIISEGVPELDGDGLRRFKRSDGASVSLVDLGALEYGDFSFTHTVPVAAGNNTVLSHAAIDGDPAAFPQLTPNWNPGATGGTYANHAFSALYSGSRWYLRREDLALLVAGSDFNGFAAAAGDGRYRHAVTAASVIGTETILNHAGLNGQPDRILLATRDPLGSSSVVDFTSPIAVRYLPSAWGVLRLSGGAMPASGGFHIYYQEPSFNAFRHTASTANVFGNTSIIDHALLDAHPCARFHITQSGDGVINSHHVGVFFNIVTRRWGIFNQDFAAMPVGAQFFVVIDPASVDCPIDIFRNGFEAVLPE